MFGEALNRKAPYPRFRKMPMSKWQSAPITAIADFERRHKHPEAGALLQWAFSSSESLDYLATLDEEYEANRVIPGNHAPDVVDVAHMRWASVTCITALDLCAAGLGRALGKHQGPRELDLRNLVRNNGNKKMLAIRDAMPPAASTWIDGVLDDPGFMEMEGIRHALTHSRLTRHFYSSRGSSCAPPRLDIEFAGTRVPAGTVIDDARNLARRHLSQLLDLLPNL